jgi:protein phosphatase PTC1
LWDVVQDDEAASVVFKAGNPTQAAEKLKNLALEKGSTDNISVMVLKL